MWVLYKQHIIGHILSSLLADIAKPWRSLLHEANNGVGSPRSPRLSCARPNQFRYWQNHHQHKEYWHSDLPWEQQRPPMRATATSRTSFAVSGFSKRARRSSISCICWCRRYFIDWSSSAISSLSRWFNNRNLRSPRMLFLAASMNEEWEVKKLLPE